MTAAVLVLVWTCCWAAAVDWGGKCPRVVVRGVCLETVAEENTGGPVRAFRPPWIPTCDRGVLSDLCVASSKSAVFQR